ncbi:MAG: maltose alpha-D-glucosyltransferase [Sandaracinaceae bacterium]
MAIPPDPHWYRDAVIYEVPIRAFYDSNADGIGDLAGLIQRLDYIADLGVSAIWVLPFYPSPLRDGGYDIAEYRKIDPVYGSMADFRRLVRECHRRGLRLITELVINHTSDQHPWFQKARRSPPGSRWRRMYVWSDDPGRYSDARIIFQDFESSNWTWDPVAGAYYWHRFYSHQPDLNFDNPEVRRRVLDMCGFWLKMGVDGMRLDAIPYLYEREGTSCENLPETHAFLKELRAYVDREFDDRMLLAEANQWPEDAAAYFGAGDECHMNFHFPLMPRMFMAVQTESSAPIHDILAQTPAIPESCQWALFLRNHDELTLEMVTDEDRDLMYAAYAADPQMRVNLGIRRRLAPLLRTRRRIELMNALLFAMPGTPVLYFGDEIGMGDNIYLGDRDSVRTPMQWSADRNAGFSEANPQKLYLPTVVDPEYHHAAVNVEAQEANPESLLWWTKRMIAIRRRYPVFGRGALELLTPDNGKVLAMFRHDATDRVLVVANLSRHSQYVELDLSAHAGSVPVELVGGTRFPTIGELPYLLTLGPHGYYWFRIEPPMREDPSGDLPPLRVDADDWHAVLEGAARSALERRLAEWIPRRRWYRGKARELASLGIEGEVPLGDARVLLVRLSYRDHELDRALYLVPLAFAQGGEAATLAWSHPHAVVARLATRGGEGTLFDAAHDPALAHALLDLIVDQNKRAGRLRARAGVRLGEIVQRELRSASAATRRRDALAVHAGSGEQSNTSLVLGDRIVLKLLRVLEPGMHPEVELGRFLAEERRSPRVPRFAGSITYEAASGNEDCVIAIAHEHVAHQGDGWGMSLDAAARALDDARERGGRGEAAPSPSSEAGRALLGSYDAVASRLGAEVGSLHRELADESLGLEPFTLLHQRELYQSARARLATVAAKLSRQLSRGTDSDRAAADAFFASRGALDARLKRICESKIDAVRTRVHGDLHLGQVLVRGTDFVFIDFEGEPSRSLEERRRPRSPVRDVAGMVRSFDYVAQTALRQRRDTDRADLAPWADAWSEAASASFVASWLARVEGAPIVPPEGIERLLDFHVLEKLIYEVGYELDHRPEWLEIPLASLARILASTRIER